jgi:hypothetical protein
MREEITDVDLAMRFSFGMIKKLRMNADKKHWSVVPIKDLVFMLKAEVEELESALAGDGECPIAECWDIGNFAAMIADNLKRKQMESP